MAGIGCHGMAFTVPAAHRHDQQMGGKANWIGQAPFTSDNTSPEISRRHLHHSGYWRCAPRRRPAVNITYKISL